MKPSEVIGKFGGQTPEKKHAVAEKAKEFERLIAAKGIELKYNQFTDETFIKSDLFDWKPLQDHTEADIQWELMHRNVALPLDNIHARLDALARENSYHPVKDYLSGLEWDKKPRLDTWLPTFIGTPDTPYVRAVGRKTLVAAVRRMMSDKEVKFDESLVLIGSEGSGKSTMIKKLVPDPRWVSDSLPLSASPKQVVEGTRGVWIIEAAEMLGSKRVEDVKAFLSRPSDGPVRMAYGRVSQYVRRQFIVIGTTNEMYPLRSDTGARRFWPVEVGTLRLSWLEAQRDQLWAEAVELEQTGYPTYIESDLYGEVTKTQEYYSMKDPWYEVLKTQLEVSGMPEVVGVPMAWAWVGYGEARQRTKELSARLTQMMALNKYDKSETPRQAPGSPHKVPVFIRRGDNPFDQRNFITAMSATEDDDDLSDDSDYYDDDVSNPDGFDY